MKQGSLRLRLRPELCSRCSRCVRACAAGHIRIGSGIVQLDATECVSCDACVRVCPTGALTGQSYRSSTPKRRQRVTSASAAALPVDRAVRGAWSLLDAAVALLVLFVALVAVDRVMALPAFGLMPASGRAFARIAALATLYLVELSVLAVLARVKGLTLRRSLVSTASDRRGADFLTSTGLVAASLLATRVVAAAWVAVTEVVGWAPSSGGTLTDIIGAGVGAGGLALSVVVVVLLGPLVEEYVFRAVILESVARRWGDVAGIVVSAVLFAVMHFSVWAFVPMFTLGAILAWLARSRPTLWPAIVTHVAYNGMVVIAGIVLAR